MNQFGRVIGEEFGIIYGLYDLVFIKADKGKTIYGDENKYLEMAGEIFANFGCTVVVSSNLRNSTCDLRSEIEQISSYIDSYGEIFFIGMTDGAKIGAMQCWKVDCIKNAILINAPLKNSWKEIIEGAGKFRGKNMQFLYGKGNPSLPYIAYLDSIKNEACHSMSDESLKNLLDDNDLRFYVYTVLIEFMYSDDRIEINDGNRLAYETVEEAIDLAATGDGHRGCLVYIYGRFGSGKTSLLNYMWNKNLNITFLGAGVADVINGDHMESEIEMIEDVDLLSDDPEENEMFKEAILQTGVEEDFHSDEKNLILILTADASPEEAFKDRELIRLIRKGAVIEIKR